MSDYISRQAAIEAACNGCNFEFLDQPCESEDCGIMNYLKRLCTSDDVVEVVRCKDCKWRDELIVPLDNRCFYTPYNGVDENSFCSSGERAEE